MEEPYQPIPCIQHERLEFSVLRRLGLKLVYRTESGDREEEVRPLDVYTRDGAEWLKFRNADGVEWQIRLDAIRSFQELPA